MQYVLEDPPLHGTMGRALEMTSSRVAVLTGGTALLAAWLSSAAGTVPTNPPPDRSVAGNTMPAHALSPPLGRVDLDREVARLAARIEQAPRPRSVRNPFTLAPRVPTSTRPPVPAVAARPLPLADTPASDAGSAATVSLAGIGADRTSLGQRRTAILSFDGRVVLARVGDEVLGRYQVRLIAVDTVELLDLRDRAPLRLRLP